MINTEEPYAKPKGAKSFWLKSSGSPGLRSIVDPNSHKPVEGNQELWLPIRLTDIGRFP
jgi:hypothetical protein